LFGWLGDFIVSHELSHQNDAFGGRRGRSALMHRAATARANIACVAGQPTGAIAHAQGARLFQLRAAMALSRLQCDPEERKCRNALLGSVYDGFVEGFDAPELKETRALLEESA
jgi:hypothetical protein